MFDVRMLFSALVDADYLETEAHFSGTTETSRVYRRPALPLHAEQALTAVLQEVERKRERGDAALHARDFVRQWQREHGDASALIHNPDALAACFRRVYDLSGKTRLPPRLAEALQARDFERAAAEYRLIDSDTVRVFVPYDVERYRELRRRADPFLPFDERVSGSPSPRHWR